MAFKSKAEVLPACGAGSVQFFLRSLGGGAAGSPALPLVDSSWEGISPQALVAVLGCLPAALLAKGNVNSGLAILQRWSHYTGDPWEMAGQRSKDKNHISSFALCQEQAVSLKCSSSYPLR